MNSLKKIILKNVSKTYGKHKSLNNINLEINKGMFGLLGHNGAGKSTLMKILTTLIWPDRGSSVNICGHDIWKDKLNIRKIVGFLPQEFNIYPQLSPREFLDYIAQLNYIKNSLEKKKVITDVMEKVNLLDCMDKKIGSFSGGMKRRLGIAQALIKDPEVLIVDEPTAGLDPEERIRFRTMLVEFSQNKIVILSTHIVEDVSASCEKIGILLSGELKYVGSPSSFIKNVDTMVWEKTTYSVNELIEIKKLYNIVSIRQSSNGTIVRFIANIKDISEKQDLNSVNPSLEDAYLHYMDTMRK